MFDFNFDKKFKKPVIGIDEVGRGSWAGPVMAGAALLNFEKKIHQKLNDSKKLAPKLRYKVFESLKKSSSFGIGEASNNEIDEKGIVQATFSAMEKALEDLVNKFGLTEISTILIDGTILPNLQNTFGADIKLIRKGDTLSPSIAAASIFAKCKRDILMIEIDKIYSGYGFAKNMGYGTNFHKKSLLMYGPTKFHRMSFSPMKNY